VIDGPTHTQAAGCDDESLIREPGSPWTWS
jgi:hypothetical protein